MCLLWHFHTVHDIFWSHSSLVMLYSHVIEWDVLGFNTCKTHRITSISSFGAVTEIYITEDTAPGTIIYKAAAKDAEDAVLEVICVLK